MHCKIPKDTFIYKTGQRLSSRREESLALSILFWEWIDSQQLIRISALSACQRSEKSFLIAVYFLSASIVNRLRRRRLRSKCKCSAPPSSPPSPGSECQESGLQSTVWTNRGFIRRPPSLTAAGARGRISAEAGSSWYTGSGAPSSSQSFPPAEPATTATASHVAAVRGILLRRSRLRRRHGCLLQGPRPGGAHPAGVGA